MFFLQFYAQGNEPQGQVFQNRTSINAELLGHAFLGSVNLEHVFFNQPKIKTSAQIGLGYLGVPLLVNFLFSFRNSHLEIGAGLLIPTPITSDEQVDLSAAARLAYRYQKPEGRFIFRAGLMPVVYGADQELGATSFLPVWPGISFGYAF